MEFNTVLDISSIVWDENDFKSNKHQYYRLLKGVSTLFNKLEEEKPNIFLRKELSTEMLSDFPYSDIKNEFWAIGTQVYFFLGKVGSNNNAPYSKLAISNLISVPNQIKEYYSKAIKSEVSYLISAIHSDDDSNNVYFTFEYLWNGNDKLKTEVEDNTKEYETIISDNGNELNDFFAKFQPKFQHNYPKHNKSQFKNREAWIQTKDKDGFVSQLSCYNGTDTIEPQRLLDKRYPNKIGSCYYVYDTANEVYVTFRLTELNIYHAYDEYNIERIPNKVKRHFNKWIYKWY